MPSEFDSIRVQPGVWPQLYRGAMRGGRAELLRYLDQLVVLRDEQVVAGVMLHGFPRDLERNAAGLAAECKTRGLPLAFSWGLDGSKDEDGTRLTVREKGECMGRVLAAHPGVWGDLNPESQWDSNTGGADDMHDAGALIMGASLRSLAPNAVLCTQPWPAIEQHGDVRRKPLPLGQGGPFSGFPIDEFASYVQFHADQRYWENWKPRKDRYKYLNQWAEREWTHVDAALELEGLKRPRTVTIQGYEHDEQPWTVVDAVLSRRDRPVIVWSDPFPDAVTLRALRVGPALVKRGFLTPSMSHVEGIKAFQRSAKIAVDGLAGYDTMKALGV